MSAAGPATGASDPADGAIYAYQWYRASAPISGATANEYILQAGDAGFTLTCSVNCTDTAGTTTVITSGVVIPGAGSVPRGQAGLYLTNAAGTVLLTQQDDRTFLPYDGSPGYNPVSIDSSQTYQTMDGFGGAITDASAWLLSTKMSASQRTSLLTSLFAPGGFGLSALRVCMGTPDFSAAAYYTYDDVPPGTTDPELTAFSVAKDENYILPVLQEILTLNSNIRIVAAPWSPPAWMKSGPMPTLTGGSMDSANFAAYAAYFVKFIQAYEKAGVPVFAISPQNEPENSSSIYPTCTWTAAQEATFITAFLVPALRSAGLTTKVLGYDHNWGDSGPSGFPQTLVNAPGIPADLYAVAWHAYSGDETNQLAFQNINLATAQWFTEICGETTGSFGPDLSWHNHEIMIGSPRAGSKGVTYWNLMLDQYSQPFESGTSTTVRALVTVNSGTGVIESYAPEFYALAHTSKFVRPGAIRIHSDSYGSGYVETVAYLNPDGSRVCHLLCSAGSAQTFEVVDVQANESLSLTMQPGDVATLVWDF